MSFGFMPEAPSDFSLRAPEATAGVGQTPPLNAEKIANASTANCSGIRPVLKRCASIQAAIPVDFDYRRDGLSGVPRFDDPRRISFFYNITYGTAVIPGPYRNTEALTRC
jgi:hypothetical protein